MVARQDGDVKFCVRHPLAAEINIPPLRPLKIIGYVDTEANRTHRSHYNVTVNSQRYNGMNSLCLLFFEAAYKAQMAGDGEIRPISTQNNFFNTCLDIICYLRCILQLTCGI